MSQYDIVEFLKDESERFRKGIGRLIERRNAWEKFHGRAFTQLNSYCVEAKTQKLFENLYCHPQKPIEGQPKTLTFKFGRHPTGTTDFRPDSDGAAVFEGGCLLHYSQSISGEVACILYPFSSELSTLNKKLYVYRVFCSPDCITPSDIALHVKLCFALAHRTSFIGYPGISHYILFRRIQLVSLFVELWNRDWFEHSVAAIQELLKRLAGELISGEE